MHDYLQVRKLVVKLVEHAQQSHAKQNGTGSVAPLSLSTPSSRTLAPLESPSAPPLLPTQSPKMGAGGGAVHDHNRISVESNDRFSTSTMLMSGQKLEEEDEDLDSALSELDKELGE